MILHWFLTHQFRNGILNSGLIQECVPRHAPSKHQTGPRHTHCIPQTILTQCPDIAKTSLTCNWQARFLCPLALQVPPLCVLVFCFLHKPPSTWWHLPSPGELQLATMQGPAKVCVCLWVGGCAGCTKYCELVRILHSAHLHAQAGCTVLATLTAHGKPAHSSTLSQACAS